MWLPSSSVLVTNRMLSFHVSLVMAFAFFFVNLSQRSSGRHVTALSAPHVTALATPSTLLCTALISQRLVFSSPSSHSPRLSLQEENHMLQIHLEKDKNVQHGHHPNTLSHHLLLPLWTLAWCSFIHSLSCTMMSLPKELWVSCSCDWNAFLSPPPNFFFLDIGHINKRKNI